MKSLLRLAGPTTASVLIVTLSVPMVVHAAPWRVGGGYLGEAITHPGAVLSVERPFPIAGRRLEFFAVGDLGSYWHRRAEASLFLDVRGGLRLFSRGRYSADVSAGIGYMHAFIAAETVNFKNVGRPGMMPLFDLGFFGINLAAKGAPELRLASSLRLLWQYPVNNHAALHPVFTLTLTRQFGAKS